MVCSQEIYRLSVRFVSNVAFSPRVKSLHAFLKQSESPSTASLLGTIGYVIELQNELQAASEQYEQVNTILTQMNSLKTPSGALLLNSMAKLNELDGEAE